LLGQETPGTHRPRPSQTQSTAKGELSTVSAEISQRARDGMNERALKAENQRLRREVAQLKKELEEAR